MLDINSLKITNFAFQGQNNANGSYVYVRDDLQSVDPAFRVAIFRSVVFQLTEKPDWTMYELHWLAKFILCDPTVPEDHLSQIDFELLYGRGNCRDTPGIKGITNIEGVFLHKESEGEDSGV